METGNGASKRRVLGGKGTVPPVVKLLAIDYEQQLSDSSTLSSSSLGPMDQMDLFCPICNDRMVSLSQLNRHLDDEHKTDGPVTRLDQDVKTWFTKKVINRATDVMNDHKSLMKLDLFDNDRTFTFSTANDVTTTSIKPQIDIPNTHWKKALGNDTCHLQGCHKYLNIKNGNVNCRKCGYLFCNEHTFFKMKINAQLQYDPDQGVLVRCCLDCFKSKPDYNSTAHVRDLTLSFRNCRTVKNDERDMEVNRLETRLTKFYDYFLAAQLNRKVANIKKFELSVVNWERDSDHSACFICLRNFSLSTMLRKHHCRLCGKIVCGSLDTQCSIEVPMNLMMQYLTINHEPRKYVELNQAHNKSIRCCRNCKKTLFDKKLFQKDLNTPKIEVLRIYETMLIYRNKIESLLNVFKDSILTLNELDNSTKQNHNDTMNKFLNNHETIQSISKERVKLKELFKKFDSLTKNLHRKLVNDEKNKLVNNDELRLEKAIYSVCVTFLQENMSKLQEISLPQEPKTLEVPLKPKITKKEVRINREKLMVLKEQKFLVEEMINNSKKKRKFDDLQSLEMNLRDIDREILEIEATLGDEFGFE